MLQRVEEMLSTKRLHGELLDGGLLGAHPSAPCNSGWLKENFLGGVRGAHAGVPDCLALHFSQPKVYFCGHQPACDCGAGVVNNN
jgi:hypothetical protein